VDRPKKRASVECGYADFREPFFPVFGNRLGERPLEAHQLLPVNLKLLGLNSFALQSGTATPPPMRPIRFQ
jgi:hypothetical protein